jgi:hypothetical protein
MVIPTTTSKTVQVVLQKAVSAAVTRRPPCRRHKARELIAVVPGREIAVDFDHFAA